MHNEWAKDYLNDSNDKCWFCSLSGCDEFDTEFDTFLHITCLKKVLEENPDHPEARFMKYLLEEENNG